MQKKDPKLQGKHSARRKISRMSPAGIEVKPFLVALTAPVLPLPKRREGRYVRRGSDTTVVGGYTGLNGGNARGANEILFTQLNGRRGRRPCARAGGCGPPL